MILFIKALVMGLSIAAPFGPISFLCINRTLAGGKKSGLPTGFGIALADLSYAIISVLGLYFIIDVLLEYKTSIRLAGTVFLLYFAYSFFVKTPPSKTNTPSESKSVSNMVSAYLLTITNPLTIVLFIGIFAGTKISSTDYNSISNSMIFAFGIGLGSLIWWILLVLITSYIKSYLSNKAILLLNKFFALVMLLFALNTLYDIFKH